MRHVQEITTARILPAQDSNGPGLKENLGVWLDIAVPILAEKLARRG